MNTRQNTRQTTTTPQPAAALKQAALSVKRINRTDGEGTLKAFCDLQVAESFLIKGLMVIEGKNGLFVSMPREQGKDGNWYDTVFPVSKEVRQQVSEAVLSAYQSQQ